MKAETEKEERKIKKRLKLKINHYYHNRLQNSIINWHFATILWCYTFCMKIQGRKCTLMVLKNNEFIPLPYSEETVRLRAHHSFDGWL